MFNFENNFIFSDNKIKHWVMDNFLPQKIAIAVSDAFPDYDDTRLKPYSNVLEEKKLEDNWTHFSDSVYKLIVELQSPKFLTYLEDVTGIKNLLADGGLHGSGLFLQKEGAHLNPHLDYKIHPKLHYERRLSFLLYLSQDWSCENGGFLELYGGKSDVPDYSNPIKLEPIFNRAVLFECTDSSWHAVSKIMPSSNFVRKAIGLFYLQDSGLSSGNMKARYAPRNDQKENFEILKKIVERENLICKDTYNS